MIGRVISTGRAATPERWQEAARRAVKEHIEVRQLNSTGQWVANSGTQAGVAYEITLGWGGVARCSCEAAQFGDICKHLAALAMQLGTLALPLEDNEAVPA